MSEDAVSVKDKKIYKYKSASGRFEKDAVLTAGTR
jgi:hypothetical protein